MKELKNELEKNTVLAKSFFSITGNVVFLLIVHSAVLKG